MFGNPYGSGLTLTKVLSGISKTLNVANQVIPIYREAKPMINNAKTIFSALKDIGKSGNTSSNVSTNTSVVETKKDTNTTVVSNRNNPSFFL